ncbi:MAG: hypothetical protein IKK29_03600, partial [Christensenellaceae bacterium]|nr:hypothetical protein [Christensenellaceae bacterium]
NTKKECPSGHSFLCAVGMFFAFGAQKRALWKLKARARPALRAGIRRRRAAPPLAARGRACIRFLRNKIRSFRKSFWILNPFYKKG